jgi:NADH dehydrogenase [ubiquinone] 1 alpha subcomplex assembly factor 1
MCIIALSSLDSKMIFEFNKNSNINNWTIVDDSVMGGKSLSTFKLSPNGYGVFEGAISLKNNGGFSSVRHRFKKKAIQEYTKIKIKLKGDGKKYNVRIKANSRDYFSYAAPFKTTGAWQEIEILLNDMIPTYRGRALDKPNFSNDYFEEITFLIGNKKVENFKLLIDKIELK